MNGKAHLGWLPTAAAAILLSTAPIVTRQNSRDDSADAPKNNPAASSQVDAKTAPQESHTYTITNSYSIVLSTDWTPTDASDIPPPTEIASFAPPFHLSAMSVLSNVQHSEILELATSNNPFIGHDSYWLDAQMHLPSGSGMSLLDFFFYYFFPPSRACMNQILTTYADASRVSVSGDSPAYLQVYYSCPVSQTLPGFYSSEISSGVTFRQTEQGPRVLAPIGDFYVAPMEQMDISGMTFFIFEAQGQDLVSNDATNRFNLPQGFQGGQPDFFWAVGAADPFPFVNDPARNETPILHVAYARLGVGFEAKSDFLALLHKIQTH